MRKRRKNKRLSANERRLLRVRKYRSMIAEGASESEAIAASGYSPTDIRSRKFWREKYNIIKKWTREQGMDPDEKVGSIERFISLYTALVAEAGENPHIMRDMKYILRYKAGYETVLAERRFLKELEQEREREYKLAMEQYEAEMEDFDEEDILMKRPVKPEKPKKTMSIAELKEISTSEFAEMYKDELRKRYYDLKNEGLSGKKAKELISSELFGSP